MEERNDRTGGASPKLAPENGKETGIDPTMGHSSHRILPKLTYLMSAQWVREALQILFFVSLARISSTTFGEFMLAVGVGQILLFVAEFGINQHLVTLLTGRENDTAEILAQTTVLKGALLLASFLGAWGFVVWQDYSPALRRLVLVIALGVGLEALASSFFVFCQVEGRQDVESRIRALAAGLGFGCGLTFLYAGAAPLLVALYKILETLANLAGGLLVALKQAGMRLRRPRFGRVLAVGRGSLVFTFMAMTTILYNKANIFFLQRYAGPDAVAQYSATWHMVDWVSCIASNLLLKNILFPLFVKLWETDRDELLRIVRDAARWLLLASLAIMFILCVESDRLIGLVYGPAYAEAVWMQKILVATVAVAFLHNLAAYLIIAMKKEWLLLGLYLAGLALNLVSCGLLIPATPLMGAVLAIVITKGGVALLTIPYCQAKLSLLSPRTLAPIAFACFLGLGFYFLGVRHGGREVAEIAALLPLFVLAWHWRRQTVARD